MKQSISFSLIVIFLFCYNSGRSQNLDFRVGASYFDKTLDLNEMTASFVSLFPISDSLGVIREITQTRIDSFFHKAIVAYEFGIGKNIHISNKLSLRVGAGLNLSIFEQRNGFNFLSDNITLLDTVALNIVDLPTSSSTCDEFLNSSFDFELDRSIRISVLDFEITGEAKYWLINNTIAVGGGIELSTPVFTERFSQFLFVEREEIDDRVVCEFQLTDERDRSGNGFSNLKIGLDAFIEYQLSNKYAFQIGYNKRLSNTYAVHQNTFNTFQDSDSQFLPGSVFARFSYFLNRANASSPNEEN